MPRAWFMSDVYDPKKCGCCYGNGEVLYTWLDMNFRLACDHCGGAGWTQAGTVLWVQSLKGFVFRWCKQLVLSCWTNVVFVSSLFFNK